MKPQKKESPFNIDAIKKVIGIQHPALFCYQKKERFLILPARRYLKDVHYCLNHKDSFAVGMQNNKEGYELRNAYFKGCIGKKHFTVMDGLDQSTYALFEGMFDFLAWATLNKREESLHHSIIVLNSTYMIEEVCNDLETKPINTISCYFDNDEAGKVAFERIRGRLRGVSTTDHSKEYKDHRNLSEFLVETSSRSSLGNGGKPEWFSSIYIVFSMPIYSGIFTCLVARF